MATNSIEYAKIFSKVMDTVQLPGLTSAPMETQRYVYNGGDEIKLPKMSVAGLSDYGRATGYVSGAVDFSYETHKIEQDRGVEFTLDVMDIDESGFVATAGAVMNELNKVQVVPEIDAYRYSKIFTIANNKLRTESYTPATATIFEQLLGDIASMEDVIGEAVPKKIYMSYAAGRILDLADKIEKRLDVNTTDGATKSKTMSLDGTQIIRVPSARFKSAYTFGEGGFTVSSVAMGINWIIATDESLVAVNKHDKMKVFTPDLNQKTDGYLIQYRRYHDLFIPDNKVAGVYVSYTPIVAPALTATVAAGTAAGTKFTATVATGNTLGYSLTVAAATPNYNDIVDVTAYTSGADIAGATAGQFLNMYELDANDRVVKFLSQELAAGDIFA